MSETPESTAGPTEGAHDQAVDHDRVEDRAHLLPEELAAGSADPEAQAAAILAESDERVADPEGSRADSTQTPGE